MTINLAASVQARLQNRARATKRPFSELLQYFAMERFLYRLSTTPHRAHFVLKGALMLHVWDAPLARATKDVDFLGRLDNSLENLERVIREVCTADVEPDGLVFDAATVKTERIKEDADYEGVRIRFVCLLGRARVTMQLDVGFGDVVTPGAQNITYPALLDFPAPSLTGYPRETVVAEKFQAMVYLRTVTSDSTTCATRPRRCCSRSVRRWAWCNGSWATQIQPSPPSSTATSKRKTRACIWSACRSRRRQWLNAVVRRWCGTSVGEKTKPPKCWISPTTSGAFSSRGDRIRTCDPLVPNQVLYQAEPLPGDAPQLPCAVRACQRNFTDDRSFLS